MAPPTKVLGRKDLEARLAKAQKTSDCSLKELTQFECALYDKEIVCAPFQRVFNNCIDKSGQSRLFEVTSADTNRVVMMEVDVESI